MAQISVTVADGRYHVAVRGPLTRNDLKQLEGICGPAFEHRIIPLTVHLTESVNSDEAVQFFLSRLSLRGARIEMPLAPAASSAGDGRGGLPD